MRRSGRLLLGLAMLLAGCGAGSAQTIATSRFYKAVNPGGTVKIASYYSIDPRCHSLGQPTVALLAAPQGGTVGTKRGSDFPSFAANNARSACNRREVSATLIMYTAASEYTGTDTFDVEVQYPDGFARKYRYAVVVR